MKHCWGHPTRVPLTKRLRAEPIAPPRRELKRERRLALAYRVVTALSSLAFACRWPCMRLYINCKLLTVLQQHHACSPRAAAREV